MSENSVFIINIGTGEKNATDEKINSYVDVVVKAIETAEAYNVSLVHSKSEISRVIVCKLLDRLQGEYNVFDDEFSEAGMEHDANACYKWYDNLIKAYSDKYEYVVIDITHGTKAMSVSIYAAGLHYDVVNFQYANKTKVDDKFVDGKEIVNTFVASYAHWQGLLKRCKTLFKSRQYEAVSNILSDKKPPKDFKDLKKNVEYSILLSEFCAAWDRFDYSTALKNIVEFNISELGYKYDANVLQYLEQLNVNIKEFDVKTGCSFSEKDLQMSIEKSINLMFDLYANGKRRLDNAQYEDAGIRVYRMAELVGQIYLMKQGYMPSCMSSSDERVRAFAEKKGYKPIKDSVYYSPFGRKTIIDFLKDINTCPNIVKYFYGEKQNEDYRDNEQKNNKIQDLRNTSVLVHGFSAKVNNPQELETLFEELLGLIKPLISDEDFNQKKKTAMFLNNNFNGDSK